MKILYNAGIYLLSFITLIISPFSRKVLHWRQGRRHWKASLKKNIRPGEKYAWIHCASLGEFEQGRPLIEAIRVQMPEVRIILTFFSPSGYEIRKNYQEAYYVCYLPVDTPSNARFFVKIVNPLFAVFVKYEFWNNYISSLYRNKIPLYLVSGIFRPDQHFFRWYGSFFRQMLSKFKHIFVQDYDSYKLIEGIGIKEVTIAGDTRFDRVKAIANTAKEIPVLTEFRGDEKMFIAGSSWEPDEEIIAQYINKYPLRMKWVFAPHETDDQHIKRIEKLLRVKSVRYTDFRSEEADSRVLIINKIGLLSSAYRYSAMAEIGGGFGKGIHNILEAACWGIPVMFGPVHRKFREAADLIRLGGAKCFNNYQEFESIIDKWLSDPDEYSKAAETAGKYVSEKTGATDIIMKKIDEQVINK
ncbi:MAG: 3-deoxy-D-manno-octulosonic acid transferase [Bacteroidales bacterium]|nr:3-deoxy-D-manno-octulosonic acid transferase [Bacteroidales bacterium]